MIDKTRNIAAIDIGSNAARILIKNVMWHGEEVQIKKLQFVRIPLRLGIDVFAKKKIGAERQQMLIRAMKVFKQLLKLYKVDKVRICATSAFREAANGKKILEKVAKTTGLNIEIISGDEEAKIIRDNYSDDGHLLYVDVGGGSTEVSLVSDGKLQASRSFNIGTIRMLHNQVTDEMWQEMSDSVREMTQHIEGLRIVGSGGNINKLHRLAPKKERTKVSMQVHTLEMLHRKLSALSVEKRMLQYDLHDSRADVIVPAAEIFLALAEAASVNTILVPNTGLADGMINEMIGSEP